MRSRKMNWDRVHREDTMWRNERRFQEGVDITSPTYAVLQRERRFAPVAWRCGSCSAPQLKSASFYVCVDAACHAKTQRYCSEFCVRRHQQGAHHPDSGFKRVAVRA